MRTILSALIGAALAALALWGLGWGPRSSVPTYPVVIVDSASVVKGEPTASPGLLERAVHPVAKPEVRATAPGAAAGDVLAFCASAGWAPPGAPAPHPEDTAASPPVPAHASGIPPALAVPAVSLIRSGRVGSRDADLWLVSSTGDLRRESFKVQGAVSFRVTGDSVVVTGSRGWWLRPLGSVALCAAGGVLSHEVGSRAPLYAGCAVGAYVAVR